MIKSACLGYMIAIHVEKAGSKDTTLFDIHKSVDYTEYQFKEEGLNNIEHTSYYQKDTASPVYMTTHYKESYTYETTPNGFEYLFTKNPLLIYFLYNNATQVWPIGKYNFSDISLDSQLNDNGSITSDKSKKHVVNFYDDATGFSLAQIFQQENTPEWGYRFKFIRSTY